VRRRRADTARSDGLLIDIADIFLTEGFTTVTVDDLARRLHCSKATIYQIAPTKDLLVIAATKDFFRTATESIERSIADVAEPSDKIARYLNGVAAQMRRHSPAFYDDMISYAPTAEIYAVNARTAARRVREMIEAGIDAGDFRPTDGAFAAQVVAVAIESVQSGALLQRTGMSAAEAFAKLSDLLLHGLVKRA
jgi:AcrR family transcriptional regulator